MAEHANGKVVINLTAGHEDADRVTVAFLVGTAALAADKQVVTFLTKEAVRLGVTTTATGTACDGCPPLPSLFERYAAAGGEVLVCPICFDARGLDANDLRSNATIGGTVPLWEWIGDGATTFSY